MIQREIAEPVVKYLQTLTYDGVVTSEEVWELANWLNQQSETTQNSWPAKPLMSALKAAFEDQQLTQAELEDLANTIVAIEELWRETYPNSAQEAAAEEVLAMNAMVEEGKPEAPTFPISAEVPDEALGKSFTANMDHQTCDCPDWVENRAMYPLGDYRRFCAHLMRAFYGLAKHEEAIRRDPLFVAFIDHHARRHRGAELDTIWRIVVVNGTRVLYGASPTREWVNVFASDEGEYKRFGYNRQEKRWAYAQRPKGVAREIESVFSQIQPMVFHPQTAAGETVGI